MIEHLINLECPYGEPEYSKQSEKIAQLKKLLYDQLEETGQERLEQLTDAYMRQETAVLRDAFADGFWSAVEMMLEYQQWKSEPK